jgi:hypothetical protein
MADRRRAHSTLPEGRRQHDVRPQNFPGWIDGGFPVIAVDVQEW